MITADYYLWLHRHVTKNPVDGDAEESQCKNTALPHAGRRLETDKEILASVASDTRILVKSCYEVYEKSGMPRLYSAFHNARLSTESKAALISRNATFRGNQILDVDRIAAAAPIWRPP